MSVALRSVLFLAGLGISFRRVFLVYFWSQILAKIFRPKVAGGISLQDFPMKSLLRLYFRYTNPAICQELFVLTHMNPLVKEMQTKIRSALFSMNQELNTSMFTLLSFTTFTIRQSH